MIGWKKDLWETGYPPADGICKSETRMVTGPE